MKDAKYINVCNHRLVCEQLKLEVLDAGAGTYKAVLPYPAITEKALTFIRTYDDEKTYLHNDSSYLSTLNYSYRTVTGSMDELPEGGLIKQIGITNYEFMSDTEIVFGTIQGDDTISKIDITPGRIPEQIILIDYNAKEATCPICSGSKITQDINFNGTGEVMTTEGHEKIVERVLKALLTPFGESAEDIAFGSALDSLIGTEMDVTISATIQKHVYDTINYLIKLQHGVDLNEDEIITGVERIDINQDKTNPAKLNITVVVTDYNGELVPCTISLDVD